MIVRSVEGVFSIMRSAPDARYGTCACCKGEHVFTYGIELPDEPPEPGTRGLRVATPRDWLDRVLYPLREQIDGARIRITIEVVTNA